MGVKGQFEAGIKKAMEIKHKIIMEGLISFGYKCLEHALDGDNRGYRGFTGNTQTSLSFGIYHNGKLQCVRRDETLKDPLRLKLKFEEKLFLKRPYEDPDYSRRREGMVETDRNLGYYDSMKFLKEYNAPKKGYAIVVTTGTEYSSYLENELDLNVLTMTFEFAKGEFKSSFKPIK